MKIFDILGKSLGFSKDLKAPTIENIAIFGYADAKPGDALFESVVNVSFLLAKAGYTVVDGGGPGVMRAASNGAKKAGGKVIAVTLHSKDLTHFEGQDPDNIFDTEIETKSYVERTLTLMKEGQIYVVFNGGTGTISEFAMAWGLARLYFGHHKPLILYGDFWHNIITSFEQNMLLRPEELKVFKIVDTPQGVLQAIKEFKAEIDRGEHGTHLKTSKGDYTI
jgi:uncharacterized protein (TIGR00730 family)